jgi:hypothetical protein
MTNREEANKLASKIKGETVNADTTKGALEAISGKSAGSIAQAINDIAQGDIPGGGDVTVEELTVTENGTYTAPKGKAYSPVNVNVSGGGGGGNSVTLYAWNASNSLFVYTLSATPSVGDDVYGGDTSDYANEILEVEGAITAVGENTITVASIITEIIPETYTRDSKKDIVLQAGENV